MTFLPVVDRELRVTARRTKTYGLRLAAALAALVVSVWICLWAGRTQLPVALGKWLFTYLSILAFAYCLLVGPFLTADSVSEERRDGTLGLLFLTELGSLDVVLGKWVATALAGLYGLLAILPALGIPLLLGGVTPGEYGRTALAVVNAMFFSLAGGMFVSSCSREQSKAILGSVVLVLGMSGLLPGLATILATGFLTKPVAGPLEWALISPAYTGYLATDAVYRANAWAYWQSVIIVQGLAWACLLGTAILVPRIWRESPEEKPVKHRWWLRFGYTRGWRTTFQRRLRRNPVFALAARLRWPHLVFWSLVVLVALNVFWLTYGYRRNASASQFHVYFAHCLVFTNRVWITVMACRFFLEARRSGALELMLTTPMPVRTLLRGHGYALALFFIGPVLAIMLLHVAFVMENWRLTAVRGVGSQLLLQSYIAQAMSSLLNFLTDVLALCWVGAWLSVSSRRPTFAVLNTFALVILLPWTLGNYLPSLATLLPASLTAYLTTKSPFRWLLGSTVGVFPLFRTVAWVSKNLVFIVWARRQLHRHFRSAAAQTYRTGRRRSWRLARAREEAGTAVVERTHDLPAGG